MSAQRTEEHRARAVSPRPAGGRSEAHRLDERLDEALAETFPASDPVAVTPSRAPPDEIAGS